MTRRAFLPLVMFLLPALTPAAEPTPEAVEFFEKKVRPILVESCQECHGEKKMRGGLRLDSRAGLLKGGDNGAVVVPGQPEKSRLIEAVRYQNTELRMPRRGKLPDEQIADLMAWVKMGAPWPGPDTGPTTVTAFNLKERAKHWAWQPITVVPPPAVKNKEWVRNPIDAFLLAALEAKGLQPATATDRRTLLRRVTFDLIGLPPTPEEIDAFVKDESPEAFEKVVDRLLASPHYGERWARHWLDLVRYAETGGHEFDFDYPDAHLYRDYVIRALNSDLPYDQFVTEHIAGDLLPKPRLNPKEKFNESIIGTGFWFLGESKHSPVDVRAEGADLTDNRIDVFGKTFLAMTLACARCHDHKFDAIQQKDYYALAGYLRSSRQQRAFISDPTPIRDLVRQIHEAQEQGRAVSRQASAAGLTALTKDFAKYLVAAQDTIRGEKVEAPDAETLDLWVKGLRSVDARKPDHPLHPWLALAKVPGDQFAARRKELAERWTQQVTQAEARYTVFEDFSKGDYRDWFVTGEGFGAAPATVNDVIPQPDPRLPVKAVLGPNVARSDLASRRLQGVLRSKTFTIEKDRILYHLTGQGGEVRLIIDGFQQIRDPIYGGLAFGVNTGDRFDWRVQDVHMWKGHRAYIEIIDDGGGFVALDRILFANDGPPAPTPNRLVLALIEDKAIDTPMSLAGKYQELLGEIVEQWRTDKLQNSPDAPDRVALLNWLLQGELATALARLTPALPEGDVAKIKDSLAKQRELEARLPAPMRALAIADGTGENEHVFIRGNHKTLGPEAPRQLLEVLVGDFPAPKSGSGRLDLAHRLVDRTNPLTARVIVNRLWQHHFGEGIVRSVDNFGVLGERPSHPELLDWLANEFMRQGWSLKKMHRLMVLSSAYRMASRNDDPKIETVDPQNRLLHRVPIRRLEAECIRDSMLAVSGRLDLKMYGPSVPPHLTPFMLGRGRPGVSGPLDGNGRRSIYIGVRRNFLTPLFLAFDYPIPFTTMGKRTVSNVPAQALTMMNNPFVVQQAELWAKRVLAEQNLSTKERVQKMYLMAFARPATETELADALAFLEESGKPGDVRAWTDLAHVLFNVKEFIFLN